MNQSKIQFFWSDRIERNEKAIKHVIEWSLISIIGLERICDLKEKFKTKEEAEEEKFLGNFNHEDEKQTSQTSS